MEVFLTESPWLSFFLLWICIAAVTGVFYNLFFKLPNRVLRHLNIKKHGWPPAHCDADGDFMAQEEE